jgi:ABC-type transport system involved in multi-copper enzyme maturation permease subunit
MTPKLFLKMAWLGFKEVLRHPLARVLVVLALLGMGVYTFFILEALRGLSDSLNPNLAAERTLIGSFREAATFLWVLQMLLALPLFAAERFTGTLDSLWCRPLSRGGLLLARTLGRSLYFPLFAALYLIAAAAALVRHGVSLEPLVGPLLRHGLLDWLAVLCAMLLLVTFACLSSSRFLHGVYWLLACFGHVQLQDFISWSGGAPWVNGMVRVLAAVWAALVVGAPNSWLETYYLGPWHAARVALSLGVGLAVNSSLLFFLAERAEVFHD